MHGIAAADLQRRTRNREEDRLPRRLTRRGFSEGGRGGVDTESRLNGGMFSGEGGGWAAFFYLFDKKDLTKIVQECKLLETSYEAPDDPPAKRSAARFFAARECKDRFSRRRI